MASIHPLPHAAGSHSSGRSRPAKPRRAAKPQSNLVSRLKRAATSNQAKGAYVAIGALGLAALAAAILGPRRLERQILAPLRKALGPPAEKLWDQARPARAQLTSLFQKAGGERDRLASDFQSWIGHFRDH